MPARSIAHRSLRILSSLRTSLLAGAAITVAVTTATLASSAGNGSVAALGGTPPTTSPLAPLRLRTGTYTYVVQDIGSEMTVIDGLVLEPAQLGPRTRWNLTFRADGTWTERSQEGDSAERSFDGKHHSSNVDGPDVAVRQTPPAESGAARDSGSSVPEGGPRLEFNPYGASFVLHLARASALAGTRDGFAPTETNETVTCGPRNCTRTVIARHVAKPDDQSEYLRSLPWNGDNIEQTVVVFEPDTQIVHLYKVTFDDVVLHQFELEAAP